MVLDDFMCRWRRMAAETFKNPGSEGLVFTVNKKTIGEFDSDGQLMLHVEVCVLGNNFVVAKGIPGTICAFGSVLYLVEDEEVDQKSKTQSCILHQDDGSVDQRESIINFLKQNGNDIKVQYNKSIFQEALLSSRAEFKAGLQETRDENREKLVELICDYWTSDLVVDALRPITSNSSPFLSKYDIITQNEYVYATKISNRRKTTRSDTLVENIWIEKVAFDLIRLISELSLVVRRKAFVQAFGDMDDGTTSVDDSLPSSGTVSARLYQEALSTLVSLLEAALKGTAYVFEMLKTLHQQNPVSETSPNFMGEISKQNAVVDKCRDKLSTNSLVTRHNDTTIVTKDLCLHDGWIEEARNGMDSIQKGQQDAK